MVDNPAQWGVFASISATDLSVSVGAEWGSQGDRKVLLRWVSVCVRHLKTASWAPLTHALIWHHMDSCRIHRSSSSWRPTGDHVLNHSEDQSLRAQGVVCVLGWRAAELWKGKNHSKLLLRSAPCCLGTEPATSEDLIMVRIKAEINCWKGCKFMSTNHTVHLVRLFKLSACDKTIDYFFRAVRLTKLILSYCFGSRGLRWAPCGALCEPQAACKAERPLGWCSCHFTHEMISFW